MGFQVLGIRHHGPGCARSLRAALEALSPDLVLIEGPPDAEEVLPLVTEAAMVPPVALLVYPPEMPQRASFYPFAVFSPEWQALHYAFQHRVPARFMDLPQKHRLALEEQQAAAAEQRGVDALPSDEVAGSNGDGKLDEGAICDDPLGALATAAGYPDHEAWWEHQIEQRRDPAGLFEAISEAMAALREGVTLSRQFEPLREAFMRHTIRAAQKDGFERIAVVCGAWHAPALQTLGTAKEDDDLLKGMPQTKVAATWVPWTYSRLSFRSGYGAGVNSPGWYEHLWTSPSQAAIRWMTHAARLLRRADLDCSSAGVIEAVRLAEALAALRDRSIPGIAELNEAILSVLCQGDATPLRMIRHRLEIGDRMGKVPEGTPAVPLQKDLEAQQKRLRLKATSEIKSYDLDLRKENDRARSRLLYQLRLLGIPWGEPQRATGGAGTFHELWQVQWQVEFVVALIEANVWGNTVESAATTLVCHRADEAQQLAELTSLLDGVVLAGLSNAMDHVLSRLQAHAAVSADVRMLMDALPALARVARYGDVRETRADMIQPVLRSLLERIVVGLPGACASLDDEAAAKMVESIGCVQASIDLVDETEYRAAWQRVLHGLLEGETIHGLVRGWCCRLLFEQKVIDAEGLEHFARLAISPAAGVLSAAAWIEGLLRGTGLALLHQDAVWKVLDGWLSGLNDETFVELLPLLRRAFSGFQGPERRAMGEKVKHLSATGQQSADRRRRETLTLLDLSRAKRVLPVLANILGVPYQGESND